MLAYPWVELESVRDGYLEARNLDKIARTEDVDLGRRIRVRLGRSDPGFGADRARTMFEFAWADGMRPAEGQYLIGSLGGSTRLGGPDGAENARLAGEIRWLARDWGRHLLTVEQRFYADWHVLRLFRVGAAAFLDVGRTWFADGEARGVTGLHRDVGLGLRVGSSRSSTASMVHLDVAFPLDRDPTIAPVQVLVTTAATV